MRTWQLVCVLAMGCLACGSGSGVSVDAAPVATTMIDAHSSDVGPADRDPTSDGSSSDAAAPATWSAIYSQLLVNGNNPSNCMGSSCHDPGVEKGLDLSSLQNGYSTILKRVSAGMPSASDLVTVLESGYMPLGRPHMDASGIALISAWIQAGAQDN